MSKEYIYTGSPMTLEEFQEIIRDINSQGLQPRDPFEHIKYSPTLQKALDETVKEYLNKHK